MNQLPAALFSLFLLWFATADRSLAQSTIGDPFVDAVRKREEATKVVDITYKLKEIRPKGAPNLKSIFFPTPGKPAAVLADDLVLESTNRIVLQDGMARIEGHHPMWHLDQGKVVEDDILSVSNNKTSKAFHATSRGPAPQGVIYPTPMNFYIRMDYLSPITSAYRGLHRLMTPIVITSMKPAGIKHSINGKECLEYSRLEGKDGSRHYYVDPNMDYNIVRHVFQRQNRVTSQYDIVYEKNHICGWSPVSWIIHNYTNSQQLERRQEVTVLSTTFNERLPEDKFDVVYPPRTIISDQRDNKRYRVQDDGRLRLLSPRGEDLDTVVSQDNAPWYERYRWWIVVGGCILIGLVGRLLWKWRLRRGAQLTGE